MQSKRGFTLIELMIVVVIVGILAAIAFPSYIDSVQKSRRADAYDALLDCASSQARFFSTNTPSTYFNEDGGEGENLCGWDGTNFISKDGHYTLAIANNNCSRDVGLSTVFWCFTVTATPFTPAQQNDIRCATFTIDERGNRGALDDGGNDNMADCWRS